MVNLVLDFYFLYVSLTILLIDIVLCLFIYLQWCLFGVESSASPTWKRIKAQEMIFSILFCVYMSFSTVLSSSLILFYYYQLLMKFL